MTTEASLRQMLFDVTGLRADALPADVALPGLA